MAAPRPAANEDATNIARLVSAFVRPPFADNEVAQPLGERWITVLGRAEQHAWIARFLEDAFTTKTAWSVSTRLLTLPEVPFQRTVAPSLRRAPDLTAIPSSAVLAPGKETDDFLAGLFEHEEVTMLQSPSLVQTAFMPCSASVINQTAYIRDFDVEVAQGQVIANPVIDVVQDGFQLGTALVPLREGVVGIAVDANFSELQKPIPVFETELGVGKPVTIQLPEVMSTGIETAAEIPTDHKLLMVLPKIAGKRYLLVITVARVELEARSGK